jgi:hypothetical protein
MSKKARKVIIIAVCAIILSIGIPIGWFLLFSPFGSLANALANHNPLSQKEMLETTLEWGRLAPLPDSVSQFHISTEGSAFTRSFRSSFYLPKADLENWIKVSPGLQDAESTDDGSTRKFVIQPGGGAQYAEAVIDFDKCYVETYVCWS